MCEVVRGWGGQCIPLRGRVQDLVLLECRVAEIKKVVTGEDDERCWEQIMKGLNVMQRR